MATFVFFPEGAYGPTNNCVGIGRVLPERGHRVVFVIEESFAGTLEAQGFEENSREHGNTIIFAFSVADNDLAIGRIQVLHAQAQRLESVLKAAEIPAKSYGKADSNHSRLNNDLGKPDDPATQELYKFLDPIVGQQRERRER